MPPIPPPTFTPSSLIDLSTKVYILATPTPQVLTLAKHLYALHATLYLGAPSLQTYTTHATTITNACPTSKGTLHPFIWSATDLSSITPAVRTFLAKEWKLDVLFLDTHDDHDTQPQTLIRAHFLLTHLLLPILHSTASGFCHVNPSIRVVWAGTHKSDDTHTTLPSSTSTQPSTPLSTLQTISLLSHELASRPDPRSATQIAAHSHTLPGSNPSGVQHVIVDDSSLAGPGLLDAVRRWVGRSEREYEGYALLYAGLAPEVRSGDWVVPWGRKGVVPDYVRELTVAKEVEDDSVSARLYEMCYESVKDYL